MPSGSRLRAPISSASMRGYLMRFNVILLTNTGTPMVLNEATFPLFRPDLEHPTLDDAREPMASLK